MKSRPHWVMLQCQYTRSSARGAWGPEEGAGWGDPLWVCNLVLFLLLTYPHRVLALWRRHHLDLHCRGCQCRNLLRHSLSKASERDGSTPPENPVKVTAAESSAERAKPLKSQYRSRVPPTRGAPTLQIKRKAPRKCQTDSLKIWLVDVRPMWKQLCNIHNLLAKLNI